MRKCIAALLSLALALAVFGAGVSEAPKAPDFMMEGYDGDSSNHVWDTNLFFSRMQERTGISFQFRQHTEYDRWVERKEELIRGEDLPDVLFKASLTTRETAQLYENGVILDLKPYLEEYAPDLWKLLQEHEDWAAAITLPDGSIPALPAFNELQNNDAPWINTAWLKTLKLEMPTTADELTEVLRAFKTGDPNRNGKADEVPLTFIGMWELRFLAHAFGIIDNDYYQSLENGTVVSHLTSPENRAFLEWLHLLWSEELIDHKGFNNIDSLRQITDSNAAVPYGLILSTSPLTVVRTDMLDQFTLMPPLKYQGKQIYRDLLGDVVRGTFAITRECKEPEKLVAWVNYLYTDAGNRLAQSGLEGEDYQWNERGYWEWMNDAATVASETLPKATIAEGGTAPGLTTAAFQMKYDERQTRELIEQLYQLKQFAVLPFPPVHLSAEDTALAAQLQAQIGPYAEETMAGFVTGDLELNDTTWNEFCARLEELGLSRMTALWQKYAPSTAETTEN